MPIKAYVGLPRAGKTYEVVVNVILPALRQGRRVVSNIAGLKYDLMCQMLFAEGFPQERIGQLVCIEHSQVESPTFWRTDTDDAQGVETFIQPGDLLALDEIWRFWKKRGDIHPRAHNFFRMHGHMPHPETGLVCEVALLTQSIRDINENIKDVVSETLKAVKNTKLGSDKSYIVHVFQTGSTSKSDFIRTLPPRFYNPDYFPLYKSHSQKHDGGADAKEANPDKRGSILQGMLFKVGLPMAVVLFGSSVYMLWRFFHPADVAAPAVVSGPAGSPAVVAEKKPEVVQAWRVLGWFVSGDSLVVSLRNDAGRLRLLHNPSDVKLQGLEVEVLLPEGGFATSYSGGDSGGLLK